MFVKEEIDNVLIVSIVSYFLDKNSEWYKNNLKSILDARKTQSFFQDNTIFLEKNQEINFSHLLKKLDEMGYEKVSQVSQMGEVSVRGGIIDIFPINLNSAIRLEFLGNTIEKIQLLETETKDENEERRILKQRLKKQKIFSDISGLKIGEYLVHLDHGIGKYIGTYQDEKNPNQKFYILEYAQEDKLYVPVGLERKLSRYIGFFEPKISRLGTSTWQKTKRKIKEETEKLAKELLEIYAKREISSRPPYNEDKIIEKELISSFPYEETPDQIDAWEEIKKDLSKPKPMDRIICGDVGFGKTELALRTMVRAVVSGYQAAMLCPTTILSQQHFKNFEKRLKKLPIKIKSLSRLQSKKEQKEILKELKSGEIDIIIGTHRILSNDVEFKRLGLLVIDDEQRFGVKQKEKLKKIRSSIDVLSLSATPIPRTLYLAMSSLKSISLIQTPPPERLAVKVFIKPFSEKIIKEAIEQEISRKGQIYYLHNRIENIKTAYDFIRKLFPKIKIGIAHGAMKEKKLIETMQDFEDKKIDVLIATTIIENGLDLPNANTLIVADSTKLGLSQAYQIKGRVGRSYKQGFAYFLYPQKLSEMAKLRLDALKEAEALGSGYKIALKDLEIRGAGNILGKEQSGNINKIGLNLYCQMLSEAIEKLKQEN
jgi:transcription-repair coupling factor (superfamily II helicase)